MTTFTIITGKEKYKVIDLTNGGESFFADKIDAYKHMAVLVRLGRTYQLIHAAPDMLEALKQLLGETDEDTDAAGMFNGECRWCGQDLEEEQGVCTEGRCFGAIARAAIAKATR